MLNKEALIQWGFGFTDAWLEKPEDILTSDITPKEEDQEKKEIFVKLKLYFTRNRNKSFWRKSLKDTAHQALPTLFEESF